jgi:tetratricopeptide (TPR) repeat protein
MYDIDQLEAQWRRYRLKRIGYLFATVGIVAVVAVGIGYALKGLKSSDQQPNRSNPTAVASTEATLRMPSATPPSPQAAAPTAATPPVRTGGMRIEFADAAQAGRSASAPPEPAKKIDIEVSEKKGHETVQEIESRFAFAKDKDDALFLARYYYDKKQYKQALKWALETNKLDSNIEESWLIFAKAKSRLGSRVEAIRIVQAYYDRTGSARAKDLLNRLRFGKAFK